MIIHNFETLLMWLPIILASFLFYSIIYRKYVESIYDPLSYYTIIYLSFSSSLMLIIYPDRFYDLIVFFFFQFSFLLGIIIANINTVDAKNNENVFLSAKSLNLAYIIALLCFFSLIGAYFFLGISHKLPIFSDSPTIAKVSNFIGFGLIRRFLWSVGNFFIPLLLVLIVANYKKKFAIFSIAISMVFAIGSGSKGAILNYIFYIYVIYNHSIFRKGNERNSVKLNVFVLLSISILALTVAVFILSKEHGGVTNAFYALINRLLSHGDAIFYYYDYSVKEYFNYYNIYTYIYNNILNPILGMMRLQPYELPTGYQMLSVYHGYNLPFDEILGPNTPFYIAADMYFGPIAGNLYAFFIAYFIGISKKIFLQDTSKNAIVFALKSWFYINSFTLMIEVSLFVGRIFEMMMFIIPVYVISYILYSTVQKSISFSKTI